MVLIVNWTGKRISTLCWKTNKLENVLHEKAEIIWSKFRYMLVTFYNTVICSIIMFDSICWGRNISKLDRRRLDRIVKKKKKKAGHVVGKALDSFKTLQKKRLYRKLMQILNDPTHPMRHYFDSNRSGRFLQIQTVIKLRFYPWLCQFLMTIIPVINWVCACFKTSVEDDNFLREGWGCVNLMVFIQLESFYVLVWQRKHYSR